MRFENQTFTNRDIRLENNEYVAAACMYVCNPL
jgi:hypothetical protein